MPVRRALAHVEPYRPQRPLSELQAALGLERLIKLSSNEGAFGPLPAAVAAIEAATAELNRYPDGGALRLRGLLAERHRVPANQIVVGNGADELIRLCALATLEPGDRAVFPWPSFPSYPTAVACSGAEAVQVACGHRFDADAVLEAVRPSSAGVTTASAAKLLFIANPNNPTGSLIDAWELRSFIGMLPAGLLCVLDEAYAEYAEPAPEGIALVRDGCERLCVLRTFSKVYGLAALRIGYAVASAAIADGLDRVRPIFNVNQPAQEAAIASLDQPGEIAARVDQARDGRAALARALAHAGLDPAPSQANFVYADVPSRDGAALADELLRAGFIVRGLAEFGARGAIRVTVGTEEENELFAAAVSRVGAEPSKHLQTGA